MYESTKKNEKRDKKLAEVEEYKRNKVKEEKREKKVEKKRLNIETKLEFNEKDVDKEIENEVATTSTKNTISNVDIKTSSSDSLINKLNIASNIGGEHFYSDDRQNHNEDFDTISKHPDINYEELEIITEQHDINTEQYDINSIQPVINTEQLSGTSEQPNIEANDTLANKIMEDFKARMAADLPDLKSEISKILEKT